MMSCLTLIPVISSKALASVFDSYSWVVIVSDTTAISVTPLALSLAAASANHLSSAACSSLFRVEGWNSSIHFLAASDVAAAAGADAVAGVAADAAGGVVTTTVVSSFLPHAASSSTAALIALSAYSRDFIRVSSETSHS